MIAGGILFLIGFVFIEMKARDPMFRLSLFRIRAFAFGNLAGFLGSIARGGLMFMLMIWFQGIWLPQHGYDFAVTPLWAGIYMIPFTLGFVVAGPLSGKLSDHFGARPFATGGMLLSAATYALMMTFPSNFSYPPFGAVMFLSGIGGGLFASPNTSSIMNSVPARHRGAASGMRVTFNSTGMPLSMGLFFTLLVGGLNAKVPAAMLKGLVANGVPVSSATALSHVPPLGYVFAAFLGYNPLKTLLPPAVLSHLTAAQAAHLTSRAFFPSLIGPAFVGSLSIILGFAVVMSVIAAVASAFRGAKFVHVDEESKAQRHIARGGRHHGPAASGAVPAASGAAPAAGSVAPAAGSVAPAASGSTTAAGSALPAEPQPAPGK
jgi:MFS family permease